MEHSTANLRPKQSHEGKQLVLTCRIFRDPVAVYLQKLNFASNIPKICGSPLTSHPHKIEPILFTCSKILYLVIIVEKNKTCG